MAKGGGGTALATEALDSSGMDMCKAAEALIKYKRQQQQRLNPGGDAALLAADGWTPLLVAAEAGNAAVKRMFNT